MMNIQEQLIKDMATDEHMPYLVQLAELLPHIFIEYRAKLFEDMELPPDWQGYQIIRIDPLHVTVARQEFAGAWAFRFMIYVGENDKNIFFGITGPWQRSDSLIEIRALKVLVENQGWGTWNDWRYVHFQTHRRELLNRFRYNQNVDPVFSSFSHEFFTGCTPFKDALEQANLALVPGNVVKISAQKS